MHQDIAIVGIGLRFPGADNAAEYWQRLEEGRDLSQEIPAERWTVKASENCSPSPQADKVRCTRAYFLNKREPAPEVQKFAAQWPDLDPVFLLPIEAAAQALAETQHFDKARTGMVMASIALPTDTTSQLSEAVLGRDFVNRLSAKMPETVKAEASPSLPDALNNSPVGTTAGLTAAYFGLQGGAYTLDAACASSLIAIELACRELQSGRAEAMLAGGLSRPSCLFTQMGFSALHALSPSGQCSPFDAAADGLMVGEGCGLVLLKRLETALHDGDHIYGLIKAVGISNDIDGSLVAPAQEGQLRSLRSAYQSCGLKPQDIDLIECHGTGTPTGDKTEFASLCALWKEYGQASSNSKCLLTSVKSLIGHLLTGAGAAGLIKVLLCMQHKTIVPQVNFHKAGVALEASSFRIPVQKEAWQARPAAPRRAAVSAFGFGGINAHLIVEEYQGQKAQDNSQNVTVSGANGSNEALAIVGMSCRVGELKNLSQFSRSIFSGTGAIKERPEDRWHHAEQALAGTNNLPAVGAFIEDVEVPAGKFRIPPCDIPHILPQQSLMLTAASQAMEDAGLPLRGKRPDMACYIGIGLDICASDYQLRWFLQNKAEVWSRSLGLSSEEAEAWLKELRAAVCPPLDSTRTMGALGSIAAGRIAREFGLGGCSYTVSAEEISGLRALQVACENLRSGQLNCALVGAVDLGGDLRLLANQAAGVYSNVAPNPFDSRSQGTCPGEGAGALVIKRLSTAQADGDHIYALIDGLGFSQSPAPETPDLSAACQRAYQAAYQAAAVNPAEVSYLETAGTGQVERDCQEAQAMLEYFHSGNKPLALGAVTPFIGHCGAAAGFFSLMKAALALDSKLLPALPNFVSPMAKESLDWEHSRFHVPHAVCFWHRNRCQGPRRAGVTSLSHLGQCAHVVLREADQQTLSEAPRFDDPSLIFALFGNTAAELQQALENLRQSAAATDLSTLEAQQRLAWQSWQTSKKASDKRLCLSIVIDVNTENFAAQLQEKLQLGLDNLQNHPQQAMNLRGLCYAPEPQSEQGETAFIYPGSGACFAGMGQQFASRFPHLMQQLDLSNRRMADQFMAAFCQPYRMDWDKAQTAAYMKRLSDDTHKMMFSQVSMGIIVTDILRYLQIEPQAAIGYSLGESAALFSLRAWPERDMMLERMEKSDLFRQQLSGPCYSAHKAWNIPQDQPFNWVVAVVTKTADEVKAAIAEVPQTRLLIVNTDDECVVGGTQEAVQALTKKLNVKAITVTGVDTVHCDCLSPVAKDYWQMHHLPCTPPQGIRFYSGNKNKAYPLSSEAIADSIVSHGEFGFDYTKTIRQAWQDGVRVFIEVGPGSSCTRMINKILADKPHFAVGAGMRGRHEITSLMHMLGGLLAHGLRPNLDKLLVFPRLQEQDQPATNRVIKVHLGGSAFNPPLPPVTSIKKTPAQKTMTAMPVIAAPAPAPIVKAAAPTAPSRLTNQTVQGVPSMPNQCEPGNLAQAILSGGQAECQAHEAWLRFSAHGIEAMQQLLTRQTQLLAGQLAPSPLTLAPTALPPCSAPAAQPQALSQLPQSPTRPVTAPTSFTAAPTCASSQPSQSQPGNTDSSINSFMLSGSRSETKGGFVRGWKPSLAPADLKVWLNREQCLQLAIGKIGEVWGEKYAEIDTYPTRVRLPDEPLMLVDRILSVEGEPLSMGSGRLVTEHDVLPNAWYLDGGRAPVFLSVEAGQADLSLCGYLGIDFQTKGKRVYRLLDAKVRFHRGLPQPGETVRYDIRIDRFVHQGQTWLFFFEYQGTINGQPFITMYDGCAGFFTHKEINENRGLVLTEQELQPKTGKRDPQMTPLVPLAAGSYKQSQIDALRHGDLVSCFGSDFAGLHLKNPTRLPGGMLSLIHRVPECDPFGGRWSLGIVKAEADVHPDDWYLTCHFVDDMVMPGTLMYECCAHALRFLLTRMGWVGENDEIAYEPVVGVAAVLKCRGPVLQSTKTVMYQVEIKEIGYRPEPYVIADAIMFADGKRVVGFENISMQMTGTTGKKLEAIWAARQGQTQQTVGLSSNVAASAAQLAGLQFGYQAGRPNKSDDILPEPQLPLDLEPGQIPAKPDGAPERPQGHRGDAIKPALYDYASLLQFARGLPEKAYGPHYAPFNERFIARLPGPPYQFLSRITEVNHPFMTMEPGGWVEAQYDIPADAWYFAANRTGRMPFCVLLEILLQACGWLSSYAASSTHSQLDLHYRNLGGTAILHEDITPQTGTVTIRVRMTKASEAGGLIIQSFDMWMGAEGRCIYEGDTTFGFFTDASLANQVGVRGADKRLWKPTQLQPSQPLAAVHPFTPQDPKVEAERGLVQPGKALLMLDEWQWYPQGGAAGLGAALGSRQVDINEWFFKAHFFQDPVIPGSLGLESFQQLLKAAALQLWPEKAQTHTFESIVTGEPHTWIYRGQVIPKNKQVTVAAYITEKRDGDCPVLKADGFLLTDGKPIYEMKDFGLRLVPSL